MQACRFYGKGDVRVEEIAIPVRKANQVLVKVEWCGICASDLHEYEHGNRNCPQEGQPHPLTGEISPVTLGHEFCGRVEECDAGCGLRKGQGVVVDPRLFCNSCIPCRSSSTNSCNSFGFLGLSGAGGGLSDFVAVNQENVYGLPDDSPLRLAALVEPLAVAWRAVSSTGWEGLGDVPVLIVGGGPIGLAVAVVIKARGGKRILVSEPAKARRERAALHAEAVFNPLVDDVPKAVRILTNNQGVGIVFDCAGMQPGMDAGMQSLSLHGTYMCVAGWSRPWEPPLGIIMKNEIKLQASMSYTEKDFGEVVRAFIHGRFDGLESLVTSRILLRDAEARGIQALIRSKEDEVKILVTPRAELLVV